MSKRYGKVQLLIKADCFRQVWHTTFENFMALEDPDTDTWIKIKGWPVTSIKIVVPIGGDSGND